MKKEKPREDDLEGLVSWRETWPSAPTAPFEQCPIHGVETFSGTSSPAGAEGGVGVQANEEDKNKEVC